MNALALFRRDRPHASLSEEGGGRLLKVAGDMGVQTASTVLCAQAAQLWLCACAVYIVAVSCELYGQRSRFNGCHSQASSVDLGASHAATVADSSHSCPGNSGTTIDSLVFLLCGGTVAAGTLMAAG